MINLGQVVQPGQSLFIAYIVIGHNQQQIIKVKGIAVISSFPGMVWAPSVHLVPPVTKAVNEFCTGGGTYLPNGFRQRQLMGRAYLFQRVLHKTGLRLEMILKRVRIKGRLLRIVTGILEK
jgi:hypothetical protein